MTGSAVPAIFQGRLRGRAPAPGDPAPPRHRAAAADPRQQGPPAVRRRPVGAPRPAGARPRSPRCCASRASPCTCSPTCCANTLEVPEARRHVLDRIFDERVYGPMAIDALRNAFDAFDEDTLAEHLVSGDHQAGAARADPRAALDRPARPRARRLRARAAAQPPLHARRLGLDRHGGVSINSMRKLARVRETAQLRGDLPLAPAVRRRRVPACGRRASENGVATTEGGDILVLGGGAVLVGMSERTTAAGVERLARQLFAGGEVEPHGRGAAAGDALDDAPRHRDDHGRPGDVHQVRRAWGCCRPTPSSRATRRRS